MSKVEIANLLANKEPVLVHFQNYDNKTGAFIAVKSYKAIQTVFSFVKKNAFTKMVQQNFPL